MSGWKAVGAGSGWLFWAIRGSERRWGRAAPGGRPANNLLPLGRRGGQHWVGARKVKQITWERGWKLLGKRFIPGEKRVRAVGQDSTQGKGGQKSWPPRLPRGGRESQTKSSGKTNWELRTAFATPNYQRSRPLYKQWCCDENNYCVLWALAQDKKCCRFLMIFYTSYLFSICFTIICASSAHTIIYNL